MSKENIENIELEISDAVFDYLELGAKQREMSLEEYISKILETYVMLQTNIDKQQD